MECDQFLLAISLTLNFSSFFPQVAKLTVPFSENQGSPEYKLISDDWAIMFLPYCCVSSKFSSKHQYIPAYLQILCVQYFTYDVIIALFSFVFIFSSLTILLVCFSWEYSLTLLAENFSVSSLYQVSTSTSLLSHHFLSSILPGSQNPGYGFQGKEEKKGTQRRIH